MQCALVFCGASWFKTTSPHRAFSNQGYVGSWDEWSQAIQHVHAAWLLLLQIQGMRFVEDLLRYIFVGFCGYTGRCTSFSSSKKTS